MNYILYDLEATCWEGIRGDREVIEIGAVRVDEHRIIQARFNSFIRPVKHPLLSKFCKKLTGISQQDVDRAQFFREVAGQFRAWIIEGGSDYALCSWGYMDPDQLAEDCRFHGISDDWITNIISIKHRYAEIKHLDDTVNFETALEREGIEFIGRDHRAIDDAENMARLFIKYFGEWRT